MNTADIGDYVALLPPARKAQVSLEPVSTWWEWQDHRVHVLRRVNTEAPARVLLVDGGGAHGTALWPIASLVPSVDADLAAVDLPLYGRTVSERPDDVRYGDWVELLGALVAAEDDGRPLVLLGASIGGLLAHEVAARTGRATAVVATCLLDPTDWRARAVITRYGPLGVLGGPLARLVPARLERRRVPLSRVAALRRMSRDPGLSHLCATDPRGGGKRVPIGFLTSYLTYEHVPPERMHTPVTLTHPAVDAWTPLEVSTRWLRRVAAPAELVVLRECGQFPVEEPGLTDLVDAVRRVVARAAATARDPDHRR